ncbi:MAG: hypothetical protein QOD53_1825 [Thermoleophilaceae bacterium]|jgi:hypothetical protein|nr:hypothetical protein [Thermoleophilaceae bacterium]
MTRRAASAVAVTALLGAITPAAHAATRSPSCRSAVKAPGTKIIARDRLAVVFLGRRQTFFRGCAYGHPVRKLRAICCENEKVRLGGRFAAYTYTGSAIGDETSKVGVYDLRSGRRERFTKLQPNSEGGDPAEIETASFVEDFAVNSRGSLVWLIDQTDADGNPTGQFELRAADGPARTERIVDAGKLGRRSVSLSSNGKTIRYRKDGMDQTAPLAR